MIDVWKDVAEHSVWIIYASKTHRNGMSFDDILPQLNNSIRKVMNRFPIKRSAIVATGFSGGGMCAHALTQRYPRLIRAVLSNTGMIHEVFTKEAHKYPRNKIAVFLASPTDFRYDAMQCD
ncbi:MAG: alpha/beta hydrolase [Candidatus Omnitrophica bacterium]|nr:alpha/beta hydrolase [Candidatus Omnitrophota bacterium]